MAREPVHPGETLREDLDALGMSAAGLARRIGVPADRIARILDGRSAIADDTAQRLGHRAFCEALGRHFGTSGCGPFWLKAFSLSGRGVRSGASVCPASGCGMGAPRACMEMRGPGPTRTSVLERTPHMTGFPDPVWSTICPYPILRPARIPTASGLSPPAQAAAGAR